MIKISENSKPWILIDKIISKEEDMIITMKLISHSDYFLIGHFPSYSVYPGVLLLEGIKQSSMELDCIRDSNPYKIQARFLNPVLPGMIVTYKINVKKSENTIQLKAEGTSDNSTILVKCKMMFRRN
ncbi:FabA-like domain protein [Cytobacillus firmus]|uniref:FabA-like domain protein n=1 Tax=Cytobacillus firmus TaxID=1399 RepID=UPI0030038B84